LRSSFGTTGSDRIGDYKFLENYIVQGAFTGDTYQGVKTLEVQGVANPYYSWESVKKLELGLDLGFLADRINLSAAYFRNRSSNQLGRQFLPFTAGDSENSFIANQTAKIENSGWEFTLNIINVDKKDFKWSSSINFSYLANKLLALPTTGFFISTTEEDPIGKPFIGITNLSVYRGIDQNTGSYQFEGFDDDGDGNPDLTSTSPRLDGKTIYVNPNKFGGFSNTFSFAGVSLDFTFQFTKQLGIKQLFGNTLAPGAFQLNAANQVTDVLKRWQKSGDVTDVQAFTATTSTDSYAAHQNAKQSDFAYEDASFIRLKNASLSYTFPKTFLTKSKLENLRIYVQGQNLWTITKYKGMDPEVSGGNVLSSIPQLRVFTAGFQVLF
jgi:TonB-dependent starch-binding outer membrane protein SusC